MFSGKERLPKWTTTIKAINESSLGKNEMPIVRHGRMDLHWCMDCDVPIMSRDPCPGCGKKTQAVKYTPPGDIRPAFPHDIEEIISLAERQWGPGAGKALSIGSGPVLLNPCPAPDRLEEVISKGVVIGSIQFSPFKRLSSLIIRKEAGQRLLNNGFHPSRGYVICDPSAVPFILDGKNLLSPGIIECSNDIECGDEVLVLDTEMKIIGSGNSRKSSSDMVGTKGMGVKMRWSEELIISSDLDINGSERDWKEIWERTVEINSSLIRSRVNTAVNFIKKVLSRSQLPVAVSYSGGKDSLATLFLVLDAGIRPQIMFIDTGIEFPETVEHVHRLIGTLGLELHEGHPVSGFYENLPRFGPPGRDFRWCCKTCKLGPTTTLIRENFPHGVLAFIGQRRFESDSRERKGAVWTNPWVPLQKGASPVQDWTALDIWLYIFEKGADYNPLYAKGFQRIGCWLCPSCDLSESSLVDSTEVDTSRFAEYLESKRLNDGKPGEWIEYGFHRFKRPPPHMRHLADVLGMTDILIKSGSRVEKGSEALLEMVEGFGSCVDGISQEGILSENIDHSRFRMMSNILGVVNDIEGTGGFEVRPTGWKMKRAGMEAYPDGTLVIRGPDKKIIEKLRDDLFSVLKRSEGCIGCMICAGRCQTGSIVSDGYGRIKIDGSTCNHCGACLGPCPAESFGGDPYDI